MPTPTMLRKAVTRVFERSMTRRLKSSKVRHPELPASATVVTQLRSVKSSGATLQVAPAVGVGLLAGVGVHVDVDEAWRDIQSRDIDRLQGLRRWDVRGDGGDLPVLDRHVANGAEPISGVDDPPALEQQVVRGLRASRGRKGQCHEPHRSTFHDRSCPLEGQDPSTGPDGTCRRGAGTGYSSKLPQRHLIGHTAVSDAGRVADLDLRGDDARSRCLRAGEFQAALIA